MKKIKISKSDLIFKTFSIFKDKKSQPVVAKYKIINNLRYIFFEGKILRIWKINTKIIHNATQLCLIKYFFNCCIRIIYTFNICSINKRSFLYNLDT